MELNELRNQIDEIDRELVSLFIRRMSCSSEVAEYKRRNALPVLDKEREIKLLEKVELYILLVEVKLILIFIA